MQHGQGVARHSLCHRQATGHDEAPAAGPARVTPLPEPAEVHGVPIVDAFPHTEQETVRAWVMRSNRNPAALA